MSICPAPLEDVRLKMGIQMAGGMGCIHCKNIFHCDLSCRNVFAFDDWVLKVGDFGGSKVDDREPLGAEEIRYELPVRGRTWEERDYVKRENFALGRAVYEAMAWKMPFGELSNK